MTEIPEPPAEFESEEELEQYIERLRDHVESLGDEPDMSEKENLELELNELEAKAARTSDLQAIMESIRAVRERINEFEEEYVGEDSDYGLPDDTDAKQELSEALGYDITQDIDDERDT